MDLFTHPCDNIDDSHEGSCMKELLE